MPLFLNTKCRARLLELLAESLGQLTVEHNASLRSSWWKAFEKLDAALPRKHADIGLVGQFSESPLSDFILDQILSELNTRGWKHDAPAVQLTSLTEYADAIAVAERLIAEFETLPWIYEVVLRMPFPAEWSSALGESFEIAPDLTLLIPSRAYQDQHPFPTASETDVFSQVWFRRSLPQGWDDKNFYLACKTQGHIGQFGNRLPINGFIGQAKAIIGLALALELIRPQPRQLWQTHNSLPILIYRLEPETRLLEPHWLPEQEAWQLEDLSAAEQPSITRMKLLSPAFRLRPTLATAGRWYFDAVTPSKSASDVLRFVQAMVVMEILFGDKHTSDSVGVERLIANRCAYSIGASVADRDDIIRNFASIYETRSAIVHRGKDTLSASEHQDLACLLVYCQFALRRDLVAIAQDSERSTANSK